jgi:branched-chain amino acid transport system ATP-binding protein
VLELQNVSGGYGGAVAVRNVSISVPEASVVALLGPNGAGKTTTLRIASGLMRPTAGKIILDGEDVTRRSPFRRARRGICHLPEGRGVFPSLTVRQNLNLYSAKGKENESFELAASAFPVLGARRKQIAGTLSGGEQQMLSLARAYISNPKVVLVDEASLGLAPLIVDEIFSFIKRITLEGVALLMVEQYVNRALELASTVYVMQKGELVFTGSTSELDAERIFGMYAGASQASPEA